MNPAQDLVDGYNNVIEHLNFMQDLVRSLASLKEELDKALKLGNTDGPALVIAIQVQISAAIMSGLINYPGILNEKIKIFESLMEPDDPGHPGYSDVSRN